MRFFFFNDTATTEIYTLSLHDALPIWLRAVSWVGTSAEGQASLVAAGTGHTSGPTTRSPGGDRKSTRLNSSHANISYAVFCLKKKKKNYTTYHYTIIHIVYLHIPLFIL